jgi:hypothetical protein
LVSIFQSHLFCCSLTGPNKPSWSDSAIDTTFDKGDRRSCSTMAVKSASVFSAAYVPLSPGEGHSFLLWRRRVERSRWPKQSVAPRLGEIETPRNQMVAGTIPIKTNWMRRPRSPYRVDQLGEGFSRCTLGSLTDYGAAPGLAHRQGNRECRPFA